MKKGTAKSINRKIIWCFLFLIIIYFEYYCTMNYLYAKSVRIYSRRVKSLILRCVYERTIVLTKMIPSWGGQSSLRPGQRLFLRLLRTNGVHPHCIRLHCCPSIPASKKKSHRQKPMSFLWGGQRELNPHVRCHRPAY